jgi:hypothetical protein
MHRFPVILFSLLMLTTTAQAQLVVGDWAERMARDIREHRMTPLRVIVFTADDKPAVGVKVRIEQVTHEFPLGIVLPATGAGDLLVFEPDASFWRVINRVSLERFTSGAALAPDGPEGLELDETRRAIDWADSAGLAIHWGGLASAEPAFQPEWLVGLSAPDRHAQAQHLLDTLTRSFRGEFQNSIESIDVMTHPLGPQPLSTPQLRQLLGYTAALAPNTRRRLRFEQALDDDGSFQAARFADALQKEFADFQGLSLHARLDKATQDGPLQRALQRYSFLKMPVTVTSLQAVGDAGFNTSIILETALLTLYASPTVEGIYFDALTPDAAERPDLSLLDADGKPTPRADVIDRFFQERFRTDATATTNDLGSIQTRVFPGRYRLTATYLDGHTITHDLYLPKRNDPAIVLIEPY